MTMLRSYKMFTYKVNYTTKVHIRDSTYDDPTGEMIDKDFELTISIVAPHEPLAEAWVHQRWNASYLSHTNFKMELTETEEAPHILIDLPY